jgi:hypothetical protein
VLEFSAAEVARILDTTPASVNSALQRARKGVDERVPDITQQAELDAIGANGQRELVDAFVSAWERADVAALLDLLTAGPVDELHLIVGSVVLGGGTLPSVPRRLPRSVCSTRERG